MKGYRKMKDHDDVHSNCVSQLTPGTKVLCDSKTNRNEVISDNNEDINDKANRNSQTIDIANAEHNNSSEAQHLTSVPLEVLITITQMKHHILMMTNCNHA